MPALNDLRAAIIGDRAAAVPFPFLFLPDLNRAQFRTRVLVTGRFRPAVVCLFRRVLILPDFGLSRLMSLGPFAEDHLAQLLDRGVFPLEQFHQGQDGSERALDFVLGPRVQIRPPNLLDQALNTNGLLSPSYAVGRGAP